jgi:hypothetical protein
MRACPSAASLLDDTISLPAFVYETSRGTFATSWAPFRRDASREGNAAFMSLHIAAHIEEDIARYALRPVQQTAGKASQRHAHCLFI